MQGGPETSFPGEVTRNTLKWYSFPHLMINGRIVNQRVRLSDSFDPVVKFYPSFEQLQLRANLKEFGFEFVTSRFMRKCLKGEDKLFV